jgi:hypothetical protein
MAAFWDIAPCTLVEEAVVSEVRTDSIMAPLKRRSASIRLHGAIFLIAVFTLAAVRT